MSAATSWIWGYSDRLSAADGERVAFHLCATAQSCDVEIARLGRGRDVVRHHAGIRVGRHAVPERAHVVGCDWPVAFELTVPESWASGYYEVVFRGDDGAEGRHMLVVKPAQPRAAIALVLATNTYHAYNWWGGANTYAWVGGPEPAAWPAAPEDCSIACRLSAARPFSAGIMRPRSPAHRIVTAGKRGFRPAPGLGEIRDEVLTGGNGWDCPAGYADKWEHAFVAWAEGAGYALDYLTDGDLDADPSALDGYRVVLFVGHSEYWTWQARET